MDLNTAASCVQLAAAIWLIVRWFLARRGCKACKSCGKDRRLYSVLPSFGVGLAYGVTPCAPLLLIAGYSIALPVQAAVVLGAVFALSSSLVPIVLTAGLSGLLSATISEQLGKALPWFQLAVYAAFLMLVIASFVW